MKRLYILTDDYEAIDARLMTDSEHELANSDADRRSGGDWYWMQVALPEGMTADSGESTPFRHTSDSLHAAMDAHPDAVTREVRQAADDQALVRSWNPEP